MAYGARALRSRSARSSRGSGAPPGRTGKPFTGRRGTGGCGRGQGRGARCTQPVTCLLPTVPCTVASHRRAGCGDKPHARFGGGPTEKCRPATVGNSPAAYPTSRIRAFDPVGQSRDTTIIVVETTQDREGNNSPGTLTVSCCRQESRRDRLAESLVGA